MADRFVSRLKIVVVALLVVVITSACGGGSSPTGPGETGGNAGAPATPQLTEPFLRFKSSYPTPGATLMAYVTKPTGSIVGDKLETTIEYGIPLSIMEEGRSNGVLLRLNLNLSVDGEVKIQPGVGAFIKYDGANPGFAGVDLLLSKENGITQTNYLIGTLEWWSTDYRSQKIFYTTRMPVVYKWQ